MPRTDPGSKAPTPRLRCAIYTRKSTEEGLDQEFNSIDAQREGAEAFIRSQQREGWILLAERYDDGGFTGANMERPALQRLLAAVDAGRVDCVVVYKVDRLSRSLLDFTRMLSQFEQSNVSFVAVTQQFNTSTSLGRLTLNILLSFAAFERDLVRERTADKMSAARKKGKWVGGYPVLGYDVAPGGGRLVVNEKEADHVRSVFELFEQLGSLQSTVREIQRKGWQMKSWTRKSGEFRDGSPFTLTSLRRLLTNILYTGVVRHHGTVYPGEHAAILPPGQWERVQKLLPEPVGPRGNLRNQHLALLNGLLECACCAAPMLYRYAVKRGRKYPYYVCRNAQRAGWTVCPSKSLPAQAIEESVLARVRQAPGFESGPIPWAQMERPQQIVALRSLVERVAYNGATQQISIRFRLPAGAEQEVRG